MNSQSGGIIFRGPPSPTFTGTYGNPAAKAQHLPPAWKAGVGREPVLPLCLCQKWFWGCWWLSHLCLHSWCSSPPLPPSFPPSQLKLIRRGEGRCLKIPFEILPVRHGFIKAKKLCVWAPALPSHQRGEQEGVSKGCPCSPLPISTHTCVHTQTHVYFPAFRNHGASARAPP